MTPKGHLVFVLHAHLPYVHHPGYSQPFLEENWLNEAILETYIPLLRVFRNLTEEKVPFRIVMSFTPTLSTMLVDPYLQNQFRVYIRNLIDLAKAEVHRNHKDPHLSFLSKRYLEHFLDTERIFEETKGDLTKAFLPYLESGSLEIITSPATHGFLPFLSSEPSSVRAQLRNGRRTYREIWGRDPKGIWLSECGYFSGLEEELERVGIRYFFVDTHGITHSRPRPKFGTYAPVEVGSGVFAFGRDPESSRQVWSSIDGYPGDYRYREYYRDIGYDLDWDYIQPFLATKKIRSNTGVKYYRITGKTETKDYYHPDWAMEACASHAGDFLTRRIKQVEHLFAENGQPPIILSPYDAELYGHWWYEGPQFIEFLCKKIHYDQNIISLSHPLEALRALPRIQSVAMSFSSWGENGYGDVWLNGTNDWIYPLILTLSSRMLSWAKKLQEGTDLEKRIGKQMGRELLLLQSSDWAFIMKTGTMVEYAVRRTRVHTNIFLRLEEMLLGNKVDLSFLTACEKEHAIFPNLQLADFS